MKYNYNTRINYDKFAETNCDKLVAEAEEMIASDKPLSEIATYKLDQLYWYWGGILFGCEVQSPETAWESLECQRATLERAKLLHEITRRELQRAEEGFKSAQSLYDHVSASELGFRK